jgi:hypothetical protein
MEGSSSDKEGSNKALNMVNRKSVELEAFCFHAEIHTQTKQVENEFGSYLTNVQTVFENALNYPR